ncbi:MAG: UDP-4-amino-4,6-dideoxy-N-acetyl-beta-L-altrosamine transaminase [bacterium]
MDTIPYGRQWLDEEEIAAVVRTLKGDYLTQGPQVEEFEEAVAEICGARYAIAVANGTAALHLAALASGIRPGDEGITSPNTFLASANCLIYCGATPKFADIQADTCCLDPDELKIKLNSRTRVIIPVHFAGQPCDMERIREIADAWNLTVIEDAAHALGSRWRDKKGEWHTVGSCSHSHMTIFSFHPVKTITTGEGGMILTHDPKIARTLRLLRNHGITKDPSEFQNLDCAFPVHGSTLTAPRSNRGTASVSSPVPCSFPPWYYEMQELGFNYRITDLQCALGLVQLRRLPFFLARRREIWAHYQERLSGIGELVLPKERDGVRSCWHLYAAQAQARDKLLIHLRSRGIGAHAMYIPVHLQPYYRRRFGYQRGDFPRAEHYFSRSLILPLYPGLTDEVIDYIVEAIRDFYGAG